MERIHDHGLKINEQESVLNWWCHTSMGGIGSGTIQTKGNSFLMCLNLECTLTEA